MSFSIAFLAVYFIRKQHTVLILNTHSSSFTKEKTEDVDAPLIPAILF